VNRATRILAPIACCAALVSAFPTAAETERDPHQRALFVKQHPCPADGHTRGPCPGYVVDHVKPLCAGGRVCPSNMQWQTVKEAKLKDREERRMCAKPKGR
jgi:hypothetical protein